VSGFKKLRVGREAVPLIGAAASGAHSVRSRTDGMPHGPSIVRMPASLRTRMKEMDPHRNTHPYGRFAAMVSVSTVVMFGLMYLNTYEIDHIFFSQTRAWMALLMGATMALVMLAFMTHMLKSRSANGCIVVGGVAVFALSLWMVRSQSTVDEVSYMKAMIPHHSIAVLTSRRADITDTRVRQLADNIIEAQVREIDEMKGLIKDLERNR
jgi:hypothetical protein